MRKKPVHHILKVSWLLVVAQLAEQSLPTQEICSSNPGIGSFLLSTVFIGKTKRTEKTLEMVIYRTDSSSKLCYKTSMSSTIMDSDWLKQVGHMTEYLILGLYYREE